jgi:hypothetical protein
MCEANHGVFGDEGQDTLHGGNGASDLDGGYRSGGDFDVPGILHGDAGAGTSLATRAFLTTTPRATRPDDVRHLEESTEVRPDRGRRPVTTRRKSLQQVVRRDVEPGR